MLSHSRNEAIYPQTICLLRFFCFKIVHFVLPIISLLTLKTSKFTQPSTVNKRKKTSRLYETRSPGDRRPNGWTNDWTNGGPNEWAERLMAHVKTVLCNKTKRVTLRTLYVLIMEPYLIVSFISSNWIASCFWSWRSECVLCSRCRLSLEIS